MLHSDACHTIFVRFVRPGFVQEHGARVANVSRNHRRFVTHPSTRNNPSRSQTRQHLPRLQRSGMTFTRPFKVISFYHQTCSVCSLRWRSVISDSQRLESFRVQAQTSTPCSRSRNRKWIVQLPEVISPVTLCWRGKLERRCTLVRKLWTHQRSCVMGRCEPNFCFSSGFSETVIFIYFCITESRPVQSGADIFRDVLPTAEDGNGTSATVGRTSKSQHRIPRRLQSRDHV